MKRCDEGINRKQTPQEKRRVAELRHGQPDFLGFLEKDFKKHFRVLLALKTDRIG